MIRIVTCIVLVLAVGCGNPNQGKDSSPKGQDNKVIKGKPLTPEQQKAQDDALDMIEKDRGSFEVDKEIQTKPVIAVSLRTASTRTLQAMKSLPHLERLVISTDGPVTDISEAALEHLSGLTGLKSLTIHSGGFGSFGAGRVAKLESLQELNLAHCPIDDSFVSKITGSLSPETLVLANTKITDECVLDLGKMTSLKKIDVRNTAIGRAGARKLQEMLPKTQILSGKDS